MKSCTGVSVSRIVSAPQSFSLCQKVVLHYRSCKTRRWRAPEFPRTLGPGGTYSKAVAQPSLNSPPVFVLTSIGNASPWKRSSDPECSENGHNTTAQSYAWVRINCRSIMRRISTPSLGRVRETALFDHSAKTCWGTSTGAASQPITQWPRSRRP